LFVHSSILQIVLTAAAALYLGRCRLALHRLSNQSWDDLVSRLTPGWQLSMAAEPSPSEVKGAETRAGRLAKLWNLCRNAQVLQEIADHAIRNFDLAHRPLAEQLHCDATRLRFHAMAALAQCALGRPVKNLA
jgi:hypothetical protein